MWRAQYSSFILRHAGLCMGRTDSDLIPFLERGWQGESLRLAVQRQSNALVLCIHLVVGPCAFPVHGAGAVGRGSVFACCILSPAPPLLGCLCFQAIGFCPEEQAEFLSGETPSFLCQDSVGEPLYMLFRGIKHQVDKGPVDWVTGKAKYTLNDNRLLREDLEYRTLVSTKPFVASGLSSVTGLNVSAPIFEAEAQHRATVSWEPDLTHRSPSPTLLNWLPALDTRLRTWCLTSMMFSFLKLFQ